ncbi:MAG: aminopeptidase P N-terminal domain-containing protein [Bdellovibrionota bacterium]
MENNILIRRIEKIKKSLSKLSSNATLLLSSAPEIIKSRDITFDFKQDTNFYYFTNSQIKNAVLLIKSNSDAPILLSPSQSKEDILWHGESESAKSLAKKIGAVYKDCELNEKDIISYLKECNTLCYSSYKYSLSNKVAKFLLKENTSTLERLKLPYKFINQDFIISPLRQIKEKGEIENIKTAVKITLNAIEELKNFLRPGLTELEVKHFFENEIKKQGASIAFDTICASGKNAATLHHTSSNKVLKKGEMLLIDCGAEYNMYAADISRTLPVSSTYSPIQEILINGVKKAKRDAINKAVVGAKFKDVQQASELAIIELLKELKILKGNKLNILKQKLHKEFYPHGVGHSLGLDTHDLGKLFGDTILKENMVITIEPGVYFSKKINDIVPCGVRIEDDIIIRKKESKVIEF